MGNLYAAFIVGLPLLTGCAAGVDLSERNTVIVTAKEVSKAGPSASGISEVFTFEGQIFAFLTFKWDEVNTYGGPQRVEARWFNGDKEISRRSHDANFGRPPHYVWFSNTGAALGPGKCRADAYVNGRYVGTRSFTVVEK